MNDSVLSRSWFGRLVFGLCALLVLFVSLVPLGFTPRFTPRPDWLFALTFAILLRRPEFVPVWLVGGVFLLADFLLLRPPGLWTALVILTCEFARTQEYRLRDLGYAMEWAFVAVILFLALVTHRSVLTLALVPRAPFDEIMLHYLVTMLAYPVVVFFCYFILRIRKFTPDEATRLGRRL